MTNSLKDSIVNKTNNNCYPCNKESNLCQCEGTDMEQELVLYFYQQIQKKMIKCYEGKLNLSEKAAQHCDKKNICCFKNGLFDTAQLAMELMFKMNDKFKSDVNKADYIDSRSSISKSRYSTKTLKSTSNMKTGSNKLGAPNKDSIGIFETPAKDLVDPTTVSNKSGLYGSKRVASVSKLNPKKTSPDLTASAPGNLTSVREQKLNNDASDTSTFFNPLDKNYMFAGANFDWIIKSEETHASIVFNNGNAYEGEVRDKVPHGNGIFRWVDGCVYKGQFQNGFPTGHGEMLMPDLSEYSGAFYKGYFHGDGVYNVKTTNLMYDGGWHYGKKHGKGWLLYEPKVSYEGGFKGDVRCGKGLFQYSDGSCYEGEFKGDKRCGKGAMRWFNNDVYVGNWSDGMIDGDGEYAWNVSKPKSFSFPVHHHYKGSWANGKRNGTGLMFFGNENGAKMAGVFRDNAKHGAAIVVCGNGRIIERNPLFLCDKPVHVQTPEEFGDFTMESKRNSSRNLSKDAQRELSLDTKEPICNPIEIQVQSSPEDIDLTFYIEKTLTIFKHAFDTIQFDMDAVSSSLDESNIPPSKWNLMTIASGPINRTLPQLFDYAPDFFSNRSHNCANKSDVKFLTTLRAEGKYLRHVVLRHLPRLIDVYNRYATMTRDANDRRRHFLCRMFLWQIYIDIGVNAMGVSLVEIDKLLDENPSSFVESTHDPFEHIYFFQYVQSLVGTSIILQSKTAAEINLSEGLTPQIFQKFLLEHLFPKAGLHKGKCLFEFKDVVPLKSLYNLYLELGEPLSARTFLKATCTKTKESPPCYKAWNMSKVENCNKDCSSQINYRGKNINLFGHNLIYAPIKQTLGGAIDDRIPSPAENWDKFYQDLSFFRHLGSDILVKCLASICPAIRDGETICNIDYEMTFLEFYEVIVLCSILLVAKMKTLLENGEKNAFDQKDLFNDNLTDSETRDLIKDRKISQKFKIKRK